MNTVFQRLCGRVFLRWLWHRHTYWFNWAHKPLCERFRRDVIRFRSVYLCRSCLMLWCGTFAALAFSIAEWTPGNVVSGIVCTVILLFSFPKTYKKLPRAVRDLLRFLLGFTMASCVLMIFRGQYLHGISYLAVLFVFWKIYRRQRRVTKLKACVGCPEFKTESVCTGFRFQAECLRQYEEEATEYLYRTGYAPDIRAGRNP